MTARPEGQRVDVLALFDAYIAHGIPQERPELQRARGAVAELVEAAKIVRALAELGAIEGVAFKSDSPAVERLRAALAACGAAP